MNLMWSGFFLTAHDSSPPFAKRLLGSCCHASVNKINLIYKMIHGVVQRNYLIA